MIAALQVKYTKSPRPGFTLVELLAALVLSSLLIVCLLAITARVSSVRKRLVAESDSSNDYSQLIHLLQDDFENCRSVSVKDSRVVFEGFHCIDPFDGTIKHEPTTTIYKIVFSENAPLLIREQVNHLAHSDDRIQRSAVFVGVRYFELDTKIDEEIAPGLLHMVLHFVDDSQADVWLTRYGGMVN